MFLSNFSLLLLFISSRKFLEAAKYLLLLCYKNHNILCLSFIILYFCWFETLPDTSFYSSFLHCLLLNVIFPFTNLIIYVLMYYFEINFINAYFYGILMQIIMFYCSFLILSQLIRQRNFLSGRVSRVMGDA